MQKNLMALIKDGQSYIKTWPLKRELGAIFIDFRVIKATKLGINILPMIAVLSLMVQMTWLGNEYLPQALTCSLFILSMPLQGLYWLGKRANTPLPSSTAKWYHQVHQQMLEKGCHLPRAINKPCYRELAILPKEAFEQMDKAFTREML